MNKIIRSLLVSSVAAAALAAVVPPAFSDSQQEQAVPYNYGPGMMGGYGYGPGMMGGYGYGPGMMGGYGMGPGMMGGYGYGPGMMGGYGMGPGMMGGYGYGPGMMGGYGMGPGMMWGYGRGAAGPDLTPDQAAKIGKIRSDMFKAIEPLAQKMFQERTKMQEAYLGGNADPEKLKQAYAKMSELQKQMLDVHLNAQKQMDSVLTKEQRRAWGPGMMGY